MIRGRKRVHRARAVNAAVATEWLGGRGAAGASARYKKPHRSGVLQHVVWRGLGSEVSGSKFPVHQVPEAFKVLGTRIAVVDVVGVLPNIGGKQGCLAFASDRRVSVVGVNDFQAAIAVFYQPGPARAEVADRASVESGFELVEGTKFGVDGCRQLASGCAAAIGAQAVPIESVVPNLGCLVEQAATCRFDDFFQ